MRKEHIYEGVGQWKASSKQSNKERGVNQRKWRYVRCPLSLHSITSSTCPLPMPAFIWRAFHPLAAVQASVHSHCPQCLLGHSVAQSPPSPETAIPVQKSTCFHPQGWKKEGWKEWGKKGSLLKKGEEGWRQRQIGGRVRGAINSRLIPNNSDYTDE